MCTYLYACSSMEVYGLLFWTGVCALSVGIGVAAIIKGWRSGSTERSIDRLVKDAREQAYRRGREDC